MVTGFIEFDEHRVKCWYSVCTMDGRPIDGWLKLNWIISALEHRLNPQPVILKLLCNHPHILWINLIITTHFYYIIQFLNYLNLSFYNTLVCLHTLLITWSQIASSLLIFYYHFYFLFSLSHLVSHHLNIINRIIPSSLWDLPILAFSSFSFSVWLSLEAYIPLSALLLALT